MTKLRNEKKSGNKRKNRKVIIGREKKSVKKTVERKSGNKWKWEMWKRCEKGGTSGR